jgi:hypothetical protein
MSVGAWGKRFIVDLALCRVMGRYTCLLVLEANKGRRDRQGERGAARRWCERPTMSRGEECASMRSMKRAAGVCT